MPTLFIIAGCNGAGKTTASKILLPNVFDTGIFINADIIAANLSPGNPEKVAIQAGRMMIAQVQEKLSQRDSFAIETTLATRTYILLIRQAREIGYEVELYFFFLPSVEMAINRVAMRVQMGGHNIPKDVIERRYFLGIKYFFDYICEVDRWYLYENSLSPNLQVAEGEFTKTITIKNEILWLTLKSKAN